MGNFSCVGPKAAKNSKRLRLSRKPFASRCRKFGVSSLILMRICHFLWFLVNMFKSLLLAHEKQVNNYKVWKWFAVKNPIIFNRSSKTNQLV